jgi:protein phosphatase 2C family protein 2/3
MIDPTIYGLRSSPLKDKNQFDQDVIRSHGIQVSIGACEMQGWRKSMEDRHLIQRINFGPNCDLVLFCIFDGHGGAEVAEFCKTSFSQFLIQKIRRSGAEVTFSHEFFENIFLEFDQNILSDEKNMGGTTVCVCIINLAVSKLFMAHMGDSRALIFHPGSERLLYQTTDHTPTEPAEIHRITCIAKTQITQGRVWSVSGKHSINVTRGLGDRLFKKSSVHLPREQPVCSVCDYFTLDLKEVLNSIRLAQASDSEVAVANSICIYMARSLSRVLLSRYFSTTYIIVLFF